MLPSMEVRSSMRPRLMLKTDVEGQDDGQNVWDDNGEFKDNDDQQDNEEEQRGNQDIIHSS